uniref:DNA-binding protein inhibitor ID-4-like n=1 Tax=Myxine glutinosa TaxID=7769 RepID=UPI00358E65EC
MKAAPPGISRPSPQRRGCAAPWRAGSPAGPPGPPPSCVPGSGDMKNCFAKLRALVPTIPHDRKISKTEFLQHVIDYIGDLQLALEETQPPDETPSAAGPRPVRPPLSPLNTCGTRAPPQPPWGAPKAERAPGTTEASDKLGNAEPAPCRCELRARSPHRTPAFLPWLIWETNFFSRTQALGT